MSSRWLFLTDLKPLCATNIFMYKDVKHEIFVAAMSHHLSLEAQIFLFYLKFGI